MQEKDSLWVIIHMARGREQAQQVQELLTREGFMVKIRAMNRAIDSEGACYEVLALNSEAKEARDVLQEKCL